MLTQNAKIIKTPAYTYTLSAERAGDGDHYTITASAKTGDSTAIPHFTTDATCAHTFLDLLATCAVHPLHLHDVWEDFNA